MLRTQNYTDLFSLEWQSRKKHMVDIDSIMTEDDYNALQEYKIEKAEGKLTSHEELKKELDT